MSKATNKIEGCLTDVCFNDWSFVLDPVSLGVLVIFDGATREVFEVGFDHLDLMVVLAVGDAQG